MLVIFDIDGTLCQTSRVDDTCWCRAAREILDIESMTTEGMTIEGTTIKGITIESMTIERGLILE